MIGISTACFYPMLTEDTVDIIASLGLKQIEVFLNALGECDEGYCRDLGRRIEGAGLEVYAVHSPLSAYEYFLLFSHYPRRVEDGLDLYRRVAAAGAMLGAKQITFHGDRKENPAYRGVEAHCEVLLRLLEVLKPYDMGLSQENVSWCKSSSPDFLSELAKRITSPRFSFTLDLKQAIRAGVSPYTYLEIMGSRMTNVHLSDHCSDKSCLLPTEGEMNFTAFFQRLKEEGYCGPGIIEVYSGDYNSIAQIDIARKKLQFIFCSPE